MEDLYKIFKIIIQQEDLDSDPIIKAAYDKATGKDVEDERTDKRPRNSKE